MTEIGSAQAPGFSRGEDVKQVYRRELDRFVGQALQRRAAVIDGHLGYLAPGQTLCVHDMPSPGGTHVVVLAERLHVLAPGEQCDSPVQRVLYGPTPANWRAVVRRAQEEPADGQ